MQTRDGYWRIEVVRETLSRQQWYRVWHASTLLQNHASIGEVQRLLGDDFDKLIAVNAA